MHTLRSELRVHLAYEAERPDLSIVYDRTPQVEAGRPAEDVNRDGLEEMLEALQGLTHEHAALVAHARSLADEIDRGEADAPMHAEYRHALKHLLEVGRPEEADEFEKILQRLKD